MNPEICTVRFLLSFILAHTRDFVKRQTKKSSANLRKWKKLQKNGSLRRGQKSEILHRTRRDGVEKTAAVRFRHNPAVQNDNNSRIRFAADQTAHALPELQNGVFDCCAGAVFQQEESPARQTDQVRAGQSISTFFKSFSGKNLRPQSSRR